MFTVCYLLGGEIIQKAFQTCLRHVVVPPLHLDTLVIYGVVAFCAFVSLKSIRRVHMISVFVFAALGLLLLAEWARSPGYEAMYAAIGMKTLMGAVGYALFLNLTDYRRLLFWMGRMALLMTVSLIVYLLLSGGLDTSESEYSMYYGYLILPAAAISANEAIRGRNLLHGANAALAVMLTLAMGARGPLLCEMAFILVLLLVQTKTVKTRIAAGCITAVGTGLIYSNFGAILIYLDSLFGKMGLSTRAIVKMQQGNFFQSSGRNAIAEATRSIMDGKLLTGVGPGRDRILIAQYLGHSPSEAVGLYPHNFFVEIVLQFGVVMGPVILVAAITVMAYPLFARRMDSSALSVYLVGIAVGVLPLMISGSYLTNAAFFYSLGIDVSIIRNRRLEKEAYLEDASINLTYAKQT